MNAIIYYLYSSNISEIRSTTSTLVEFDNFLFRNVTNLIMKKNPVLSGILDNVSSRVQFSTGR